MHEALRRARQVVAATMNPTMLAGDAASRFDWIRPDGSPDPTALIETKEAIELLMTDRAILHVGRIHDMPTDPIARQELSTSIVRVAFDRLGSRRGISEGTLNAALAMFVDDVALVRRDAVDSGVLTRAADGSAYSLSHEEN